MYLHCTCILHYIYCVLCVCVCVCVYISLVLYNVYVHISIHDFLSSLLFCLCLLGNLSGKLSEFGLIVPFSTNARGRFVSHVLSARVSPTGRKRVPRSAPVTLNGQQLFFNVTVFGKRAALAPEGQQETRGPWSFCSVAGGF